MFQAEDGIRDVAVTGVQTCALPISGRVLGRGPSGACPDRVAHLWRGAQRGVAVLVGADARAAGMWRGGPRPYGGRSGVPRSEERRVGKGGRDEWLPEVDKQKIS